MARAMHRTLPDQRWSAARVLRIAGTPIDKSITAQDRLESLPSPHAGPGGLRDDGPDDDEKTQRRIPILLRDLQAHGFIDGCTRCQLLKDGQTIRARSYDRTETCRSRIYQALRTAGDPRIVAADAPVVDAVA